MLIILLGNSALPKNLRLSHTVMNSRCKCLNKMVSGLTILIWSLSK